MDPAKNNSNNPPTNSQAPTDQPSGAQIGSIHKESPVITPPQELSSVRDLGKEEELAPEVKGAGVRAVSDRLDVPEDILKVGVRPPPLQVPLTATLGIKLPITDEKIEQGLHQSVLSSLRWLAEWCIYQLKRAHLTILKIQGKVRRVRYKG